MKIRISGGARDGDLIVGNAYDKYGSTNPIVRRVMAGFESAMAALVGQADPSSIHEVGCGEGFWVVRWTKEGLCARGSDVSGKVIELARENAARENLPSTLFEIRSIYELVPERDAADLVVCSEVLEHLESPRMALEALRAVALRHALLSVPREPLWRALNLARGSYVSALGNTPGHVNHWSVRSFVALVSSHFHVIEVRTPPPWTMVLCRPRR